MNDLSIRIVAFYAGLASIVIGGIAFALNWNVWGGGMPGYRVFLFPGNLVLSIFTEEIDFWPKLLLQFTGQFIVVASVTAAVVKFFQGVAHGAQP